MSIQASRKFRFFSFAFTLILVLYHGQLDMFSEKNSIQTILPMISRFYSYLGSIGMSYFFMTSGYLLYYNISETSPIEKAKKRIRSLLIPFLVWNGIYMLFEVTTKKTPLGGMFDILYHFSIAPYNGPLWYVFVVFFLSLLSIPVVIIKRRHERYLICVLIFCCIISILIYGFKTLELFGLTEDNYFIMWLTRVFRYLPSYIVGCAIGLYKSNSVNMAFSKSKYLVCFLAFFLSALWMAFEDLPPVIRQFIATIQPVLIWMIIDNSHFDREISKTIKCSFLMYCIHFLIISAGKKLLAIWLPSTITEPLAFMVWFLFPFVIIAIVYLSARIISSILDKLHLSAVKSLLTGNRE